MGYTKGPWRIGERWVGPKDERYLEKSIMTDTNPSNEIATVTHRWNGIDEANARLIAAAPDLLEVADALVKWVNDQGKFFSWDRDGNGTLDADKEFSSLINQAEAAIARILGEG